MTPAQEIYRRRPDVRFRTVLDEAVVVRIEAAEVLVVNSIGARILELVDGERTLEAIEDLLRSEFEVEETRLHEDLETFLAELTAAGIVESVAGVEGSG